jgi:phosphatidylinositol glycan class H protein
MVEFSISNARYTYVNDKKYPAENADMHHIILRSGSKYFLVYTSALLVLACAIYLYFLEVWLPTNFLCHTDSRILKIL